MAVEFENGGTPLRSAIWNGNFGCVKILLQSEYIDVKTRDEMCSIKDREGLTAIQLGYELCDPRNFKLMAMSIGKEDDHYNNSVIGFNVGERFPGPDNENNEGEAQIKGKSACGYSTDWWNSEIRGAAEIFTLGSNVNNILGCGDADDKLNNPHKVKLDRKHGLIRPRVKELQISKFHTMVLTTERTGNVLVCGTNKFGRLGLGTNDLVPKYLFQRVGYFENLHIEMVSVSEDHTLALDSNSKLYAWGSNSYGQLGYETDSEYNNIPEQILSSEVKRAQIIGISSSKIHSLAFSDSSIFFWGLNIGQFGALSNSKAIKYKSRRNAMVQNSPLKLPISYGPIKQVFALEFATCVLTQSGDIHIYMNSFHARIVPPSSASEFNNNTGRLGRFDMFEPQRVSAKSTIRKISGKGNFIGLLYENGYVVTFSLDEAWSSASHLISSVEYNVAWGPKRHGMMAIDVDIGADGSVIVATYEGIVYKRKGVLSVAGVTKNSNKPVKACNINRIVKVCCDPSFSTFGFLKDDVDSVPLKLRKSSFYEDIRCLSPLASNIENDEVLNDECYFACRFLEAIKDDLEEEDEFHRLIAKRHQADLSHNYKSQITNHKNDLLYKAYLDRWYKSSDPSEVYQIIASDLKATDFMVIAESIKTHNIYDSNTWRFEVEGVFINVIPEILAARSLVLFDLFIKGNTLTSDDLFVHVDLDKQVVSFSSDIPVLGILVLLHFAYTDEEIHLWEEFSIGEQASLLIQATKKSVLVLGRMFKMVNVVNKFKCEEPLIQSLDKLVTRNNEFRQILDAKVVLQDGETMFVSSNLLSSRSHFFRRCFANHWSKDDDDRTVEFEHVSKTHFEVILRYLYGHNPLNLFEFQDRYELFNYVFELLDLCDEWLLLDLKDYLQYYICELIDSENVSLLIRYALQLNAKRLFELCCWYIFHNMIDILVNHRDISQKYLDQSVCFKLDRYFKFFLTLRSGVVKDVDYSINTYKFRHARQRLHQFIFDTKSFSENYIAPGSKFEPLIDLKLNKGKLPKVKLSTHERQRRKSSMDTGSANVNIRKSSASSLIGIKGIDLLDYTSFTDSFAIDDGEDAENFVVVTRRRKSLARTSSSNMRRPSFINGIGVGADEIPEFANLIQLSPPSNHLSKQEAYRSGASSPIGIPKSSPAPSYSSQIGSSSRIAAHGTSSQITKSTSLINSEKPSSLATSSTYWPTLSTEQMSVKEGKKKFSNNFGKISMIKHEVAKETRTPGNPWSKSSNSEEKPSNKKSVTIGENRINTKVGTSAAPVILSYAKPKKNEEEFPLLGGSVSKDNGKLNLADIILQESLKKEAKLEKEASRRTLAEIQQEEEFNKWFEEESKRVQDELSAFENNVKTKDKKKLSKPDNVGGLKADKNKKVINNKKNHSQKKKTASVVDQKKNPGKDNMTDDQKSEAKTKKKHANGEQKKDTTAELVEKGKQKKKRPLDKRKGKEAISPTTESSKENNDRQKKNGKRSTANPKSEQKDDSLKTIDKKPATVL